MHSDREWQDMASRLQVPSLEDLLLLRPPLLISGPVCPEFPFFFKEIPNLDFRLKLPTSKILCKPNKIPLQAKFSLQVTLDIKISCFVITLR